MAEEYTRGQKDDAFHQREHAFHRDANNAKRQQEQPDKRINDRGQQSQRPAHYQQQTPEHKGQHNQVYEPVFRKVREKNSERGAAPLAYAETTVVARLHEARQSAQRSGEGTEEVVQHIHQTSHIAQCI